MYHFLFLFKMYSVLLPYNILCNIWTYCQMKYVIPFFPHIKVISTTAMYIEFYYFFCYINSHLPLFFSFFPPLPVAYKTYFTYFTWLILLHGRKKIYFFIYYMEFHCVLYSITWGYRYIFSHYMKNTYVPFSSTKCKPYSTLFITLKKLYTFPYCMRKKYIYIFPITR